MRYDSEHKAKTRERVLEEAAAAIREKGAEGVGIAEIMARAGLTHGGFYAHFRSKDDLIAQAIEHMFAERYARLTRDLDTTDPRATLGGLIDTYLSTGHRDRMAKGCPIPALSGETPRLSSAAQAAFDRGVGQLTSSIATLLSHIHGDKEAEAMAKARSTVAEMAGALGLSRTAASAEEGEAMLAASRRAIRQRLGLDQA